MGRRQKYFAQPFGLDSTSVFVSAGAEALLRSHCELLSFRFKLILYLRLADALLDAFAGFLEEVLLRAVEALMGI